MHISKIKLGVVSAAALAAALPLLAQPAFADYAPSSGDVVGVGSDTVQYGSDFVADGDFLGDTGYNALGNLNRVINFDATPDANARLAYGSPGVGSGTCGPGLGGTVGTGNQTTTHTDKPCTLNPTIVLRAGLNPVQRPNGSGGGASAGAADTHHYIDYVRASAAKGTTLSGGSPSVQWDDIVIGQDPLQMAKTTTPVSNAVPLSNSQLNLIYSCQATTWNDARIGGTSADTIIPVIPQVGSGTRSSFLSTIGLTAPGSCVQVGEENDPFALSTQTNPADAIEPLSGGRLDMFQGKLGNGQPNGGSTSIPYFQDPSCPVESSATACAGTVKNLVPAVQLISSGTPAGTPAPGALFSVSRPLYVYFRDSDINSTKVFQPGGSLNFVRTLFYNPCAAGQTGCTTVGTTTYGPGGAPFYASSTGQALISAAGIAPAYSVNIPGA